MKGERRDAAIHLSFFRAVFVNSNNNRNDSNNENNNSPFGGNRNAQRVWLIIAGVVILLFIFAFAAPGNFTRGNSISLPEFAQYIRDGEVRSIEVRGGEDVVIVLNNGTQQTYYKDRATDLFQSLETYGITDAQLQQVEFTESPGDNTSNLLFQLAVAVVPTLLIIWLLWRMMRSVRTGQDQALSFGRSRARVTRDVERPQVTFADVAGCEEAKEELKEIVEFLKEPEKFIRLGARIPKGVLMVGPPGTGKTLMARAVAGEAGVPFFSISGSEFVEMFVGVGASRVRDLFERAKAEAPAIIFVDEIDAVGRHRGAGLGGGHDEREQTLNQILVEMDGFETGTNVIVCAATNRPDILDPALLRPGRFDRKVIMDNPDIKGRQDILKVHTKGKPLAPDADIEQIAKMTVGFSGADLENLVNEAAILTARRNKKSIGMSELSESMDRVVMGPERKSRVISDREKQQIAYHEAGHAILHHLLTHSNPVAKITIVPRGRAGGYVMARPDEEEMLHSKEWFEDTICAALGGRAAEEIVFNMLTTGASSDLEQVTNWSRAMVTRFGMSERLGPRTFGGGSGSVFLGRDMFEQRDYSEQAAEEIDAEVRRILTQAYERARTILTENRDKLDLLVKVLLEQETLDRTAFEELMNGGSSGGSTPPLAPAPSTPGSQPSLPNNPLGGFSSDAPKPLPA